MAKLARKKGIKIIIAHGETVVEPVIKGTNCAAIDADIDLLAHPGLISEKEVRLAKKRGIFLEITTRLGHSDTNPDTVRKALELGASLILNHDSHLPEDIISPEQSVKIAKLAGLTELDIEQMYNNVKSFLRKREKK